MAEIPFKWRFTGGEWECVSDHQTLRQVLGNTWLMRRADPISATFPNRDAGAPGQWFSGILRYPQVARIRLLNSEPLGLNNASRRRKNMISASRSVSLKAFCATFVLLLLGGMSERIAKAQNAPAPIGNWINQGKTNGLVVEQNGTCGFLVNGKAKWSGKCTWQASAKGGILTLTYPMPLQPGHIRWSVVYINQTSITVDGEAFYKQGQ
jgi:hypothetical protein